MGSRRRRRVLIAVGAVIAVLLGAVGCYAWLLNRNLGNIDRVAVDSITGRPDPDSGRDLHVLLLGVDKEDESEPRSDVVMVVHVSADRKRVGVVSIPRDSLVTVYDETGAPRGEAKINAAYERYGAAGAVATVEHLTGLRLDHLALIDWAGFRDLSTAVGGVPVIVPEAFYDYKQDKHWEAREYLLKDEEALQYVRTRHGLLRGDFDRIERQQNFMRSLMRQMLESGSLMKPLEFNEMLGALTRNLTVDEGWDDGEIRSLALSLRGMKESAVTFLTVPVSGTPTVPVYGSIVELDLDRAAGLFRALADDRLRRWVAANPDVVLPDADEVG